MLKLDKETVHTERIPNPKAKIYLVGCEQCNETTVDLSDSDVVFDVHIRVFVSYPKGPFTPTDYVTATATATVTLTDATF